MKKYSVGDKIKFRGEKQRFTVQARDDRFLICTKPLNMIRRVRGGYKHTKTVIYTIVDFKENRRGPENLVFGFGAETREQCGEMLARLNEPFGERSEVSYRHDVPLDIESLKEG
jgi:hypothetical protein